jgi:purine-binding chemotaxis protein CheW
MAAGGLHVVFVVAGTEYVVPASDVLQMESFTGATEVPGVAPHVRGIIQVRGHVVPVVDVRRRFELPAQEPTIDTRVVIASVESRAVALLVDSAREVVRIGEADVQRPPEAIAERSRGFVRGIARAGERLFLLVDLLRLVGGAQEAHA